MKTHLFVCAKTHVCIRIHKRTMPTSLKTEFRKIHLWSHMYILHVLTDTNTLLWSLFFLLPFYLSLSLFCTPSPPKQFRKIHPWSHVYTLHIYIDINTCIYCIYIYRHQHTLCVLLSFYYLSLSLFGTPFRLSISLFLVLFSFCYLSL